MSSSFLRPLLGLDIGGANIKWFHSAGNAGEIPFAMWRNPLELANQLRVIAASSPTASQWLVTMTGEMADCFSDRLEGVRTIVDQVAKASVAAGVDDLKFYAIPGAFLDAQKTLEVPVSVASANWHAMACWVASWVKESALLIDIGTTTADLIRVSPGQVDSTSLTDHDRLVYGELVYLGGKRTPVCSLVSVLPFRGQMVPIMREVFANTDDCALILGWIEESIEDLDSCDGKPRTRANAVDRIARMIGLDGDDIDFEEAKSIATYVIDRAKGELEIAINKQTVAPDLWVVAGHSRGLVPSRNRGRVVYLDKEFGPHVSRVGPAFALCQLALRQHLRAN